MTDNTKYEVTRDEALSFCETAMRNWQYVAFSEDELDDLRVGLERFLSARLTSQPAPGDLVERARTYVASSMHDRDKSWGDLVLAGERDDCPEMRMVLKAMQSEAALSAAQQGQGELVAWRFRRVDGSEPGPWKSLGSSVRPNLNREYRYEIEPLYAHPPTAPQPDRESVLREACRETLRALTCGQAAIVDTVWVAGERNETLFDCVAASLDEPAFSEGLIEQASHPTTDTQSDLCAEIAQKSDTQSDAVQPLETAPKDGTYFLMVGDNFDGKAAVVCWDDDWWMLDDGKNFEIPLRAEHQLRGWMPLPTAIRNEAADTGCRP